MIYCGWSGGRQLGRAVLRWATKVEQVCTGTGFLLSLWVQRLLFPALGHDLVLSENLLVSTVFTTLSLLRGYGVRRLFNALRDRLP